MPLTNAGFVQRSITVNKYFHKKKSIFYSEQLISMNVGLAALGV
jgi:hypothetical protein